MNSTTALILSIAIIVSLLVIFVVSFVVYKKMPVPKGCENIEINDENCAACNSKECAIYKERRK